MAETASAGATPAVGGATPSQSTPAQPASGATDPVQSATDDALGEPGKRAIQAERERAKLAEDRAKAAERERDELKAATQSDAEKAIAQAKKDGAAEVAGRYEGAIRRSEVRSRLTAVGINPAVMDLATRADEFAALKVNDRGEVEGLEAAVDAFKRAMPDLFAKPTPRGTADFGGGPRGGAATGQNDMNSLIRRQAGRA